MPALPIALLAFAAGATLLQWQAELPRWPIPLVVCGAVAGAAIGWRERRRRERPADTDTRAHEHVRRALALALIAVACAALGFGYAGWRAQLRLADALGTEWEGVDIALVGVVDDLPQISPRSTR